MNDQFTAYYEYWKSNTNYTERSALHCRAALSRLEEFLISEKGFSTTLAIDFDRFYYDDISGEYDVIDELILSEFISYSRSEKSASHYQLYNTIVYLKALFNFLYLTGKIRSNPMAYFNNPFYQREIKNRWLTHDNCSKLLDYTEKSDHFLKQDYVLILLLLTTGLRSSEVCKLCSDQIDLENSLIHVERGQKTTIGVVYIPDALKIALKNYLFHPFTKKRIESGLTNVFLNKNIAFNKETLRRKIIKLARESGVTQSINVHTFRYTTAKLMYDSGINVVTIQKQLRHKQISTTLRYLGIPTIDRKLVDDLVVHENDD